jgi:hypothetical protein
LSFQDINQWHTRNETGNSSGSMDHLVYEWSWVASVVLLKRCRGIRQSIPSIELHIKQSTKVQKVQIFFVPKFALSFLDPRNRNWRHSVSSDQFYSTKKVSLYIYEKISWLPLTPTLKRTMTLSVIWVLKHKDEYLSIFYTSALVQAQSSLTSTCFWTST